MTLSPIRHPVYTRRMADTEGLAGNTRQFKTNRFVLYRVLYLTCTTSLAIILDTIDSQ